MKYKKEVKSVVRRKGLVVYGGLPVEIDLPLAIFGVHRR